MSVDIARERDMFNKRETKRDKDGDKVIDTQSVEREGGISYIYIGLSNNMVLRERRREEGRDERTDGEI